MAAKSSAARGRFTSPPPNLTEPQKGLGRGLWVGRASERLPQPRALRYLDASKNPKMSKARPVDCAELASRNLRFTAALCATRVRARLKSPGCQPSIAIDRFGSRHRPLSLGGGNGSSAPKQSLGARPRRRWNASIAVTPKSQSRGLSGDDIEATKVILAHRRALNRAPSRRLSGDALSIHSRRANREYPERCPI